MGDAALDMTNDEQVTVRVPGGTWDRAETIAAALADRPEFRAMRLSRSTILRMALLEGLDALEARYRENDSGG